jgi:hypothetical protein
MSITAQTPVRNAMCNGAVDLLDAGTTVTAGYIKVQTAGDVDLVQFNLDTPPAMGDAAAGASSANNLPKSGTGLAAGAAAKFRAFDRDNTELWEGTVTATGGGGDAEIDNTSIAIGQTVNLTAFSMNVVATGP